MTARSLSLRLVLAISCLLLASGRGLFAAGTISREYEIKAAYLYNFINYIDFPGALGGTITIGVLGENPFGGALKALDGKHVKGRTIEVKDVSQVSALKGCQIAFISSSEKQRIPEILASLDHTRVLTVSETDGFSERGGIINFINQHNKVRFEINPVAAQRHDLTISSELLKLARLVKS